MVSQTPYCEILPSGIGLENLGRFAGAAMAPVELWSGAEAGVRLQGREGRWSFRNFSLDGLRQLRSARATKASETLSKRTSGCEMQANFNIAVSV